MQTYKDKTTLCNECHKAAQADTLDDMGKMVTDRCDCGGGDTICRDCWDTYKTLHSVRFTYAWAYSTPSAGYVTCGTCEHVLASGKVVPCC